MARTLVILLALLLAIPAKAQQSAHAGIAPLSLRLDPQLGVMFGGISGVRADLAASLRYRFVQAGVGAHAGSGWLSSDNQVGLSFDAGFATESATVRWDLVGRIGFTKYSDIDADPPGLACISCEGERFVGVGATLPFAGMRTALMFRLARFTSHSLWLGVFAGWERDLGERTIEHGLDYVDDKLVNGKTTVGGWTRGSMGASASMTFDLMHESKNED